jgi:MerR family transcriptional regulator, copper efflux regulator
LERAARTEGGYRLYDAESLGRLRFIQRAKSLGLSLGEIRQLVQSTGTPSDQQSNLRHLVAHKLAEVRQRQQDLAALSSELEHLYIRLLRQGAPPCGRIGDCECWLPTAEEVTTMTEEIKCCGELCCPDCACTKGQACDCSECPCAQGQNIATAAGTATG